MEPPVPDLIVLTDEEWQPAAEARLAELGLTYSELEAQAKLGNFDTTAARKLWYLIGGSL